MKKIADFFKAHRYVIIWTLCYIFAMKFILGALFNFNMFSQNAWIQLAHSHLHGFGGFVFGLMVLAAVPMYAATTAIIIRTKKPLFTIPLPGFIVRAFAPPAPEPAPEPAPAPKGQHNEPEHIELPQYMPLEMRGAFIRTRRGGIRPPVSAFDTSHITNMTAPAKQSPTTATETESVDDFPLPSDFDTPGDADINFSDGALPSFTTIDFDSPTTSADTQPSPQPGDATPEIIKHLTDAGHAAHSDGEFIVCDKHLIAIHTDNDFWIADDVDWFAGGKQRPSPIAAVIARAAQLELQPALYLGATNILDLEQRIAKWESDGIRIIKDLSEL